MSINVDPNLKKDIVELELGFFEQSKNGTDAGSSICEKVILKASMMFNSKEVVYNIYVDYTRQERFWYYKKQYKIKR